MTCLTAWQVIPRGAVVRVLDAVRSKLLSFAVEIEREAPDAGQAAPGEHPVTDEKVTQVFNTTIYGGQSTLAVGSRDVVQRPVQVQLHVQWEQLEADLHTLGLGTAETAELRAALEQDAALGQADQLGPATQRWLRRIKDRVADGSLTLASGVTTSVVAGAVLKALGLAYAGTAWGAPSSLSTSALSAPASVCFGT